MSMVDEADRPLGARGRGWTVVLFTLTIFASALLLFFVQPLFTRMVLPRIGGAAAVWTTAMLFFQATLIGGYLYAHLITRHLAPRLQVGLHAALILLALLALPLAVPEAWAQDPGTPIVLQTIWLYALGVGLPFAVLSANAPLIQSWYARTGGPSASDPYFLYAASNLGSFIALLGFPLVAEPLFGITAISAGWSVGFVALGALLVACGLVAARGRAVAAPGAEAPVPASDRPLTARQIGTWIFLAFLPSSLMLCVTTKISTDMGSFPLVWVVPLALYLLTFVLVFSAGSPLTSARLARAYPLAIVALVLFTVSPARDMADFALLIGAFFLASLFAHRLLFEARPDPRHLTLFYVVMSVGGALGGLFNSILAPLAFTSLAEFWVTVLLAGLLLLSGARPVRLPWQVLAGLVLGVLGLLILVGRVPLTADLALETRAMLAVALPLAVLLAVRQARILGLAALAGLMLPVVFLQGQDNLVSDRSFFGLHEVNENRGMRQYTNGTTIHGAQRLPGHGDPLSPIFYYHPAGPLAQAIRAGQDRGARTVGIVGLGVGALSCYARPGEDWHFYEIDQKVVDIALDPALFTFMPTCAPDPQIHLGDARIVLAEQDGPAFDVLVIDAYSSDAIPVHLATVEAIELYLDRLAPEGILVFHISNRFYDLARPLATAAGRLGLEVRFTHRAKDELTDPPFDVPTTALVLARTPAALGALAEDPAWESLPARTTPLWTDDHANLLSALR